MITNEQLKEWEENAHVPGLWTNEAVPELIAEVRKLRMLLQDVRDDGYYDRLAAGTAIDIEIALMGE